MKQAHFSVETIEGNNEQFHLAQGGDIDQQVRMIVAALSSVPGMTVKVVAAILEKCNEEVVEHESI